MSQTPTPQHVERLKALFAEALDAAPSEREAILIAAREESVALGNDLDRMLKAHAGAEEGFLVDPTIAAEVGIASRDMIGPFRLLRLIGEGGFGEVYLAEQAAPIKRRVALKIIRPGMDGGQFLARFDTERAALAIMDHPNIASVYDAGADDRGRPWFAMEFVDGEPIHTFADTHRLNVRERIELMIPVCRAVHHAHQKGVIHRDLKPGNVIVSKVDGRAVPKVIDFGVAKALDRPLTDQVVFTELRSLIGTPEYMSPEQADLDGGRDVDTRSDVYGLGVLLYELLVGATPFDGKQLRSAAFGEIQRILREVDPPTPSTRFSRLESRASAAASRSIDPARLSTSLRGELDWITMKCLEKDRGRRYDSAAGLAEELARYLENRPIVAGPVSRSYRLRKYVRRHRIGVVAAAVMSLAISAGLAGIIWGAIEARRERDDALHAREQAVASKLSAEQARRAEAEARAVAQENNTFLRAMFESIDPSVALGKEISVREVLDASSAKIDVSPPANPAVEASLRGTFGRAYAALGLFDPARKQLERARELKDESPDTLRALIETMSGQADYEPALALAGSAIEDARAAHGEASLEGLTMQNARASVLALQGKRKESEDELNLVLSQARTLATTRPAIASGVIAEAISALSSLQIEDGRFAEAEKLLLEAVERTRVPGQVDGPTAIALQSTLGDLYRNIGRFDEAIPLLSRARDTAQLVMGPDHTYTLTVSNNLALALLSVGRVSDAEALYDDVVARRSRVLGEDHPRTLIARSNRGLVYQQQARFAEAEKEFADLATRYTRVLGPDHQDTIVAENNLATVLVKQSRFDEAEPIFQRLIERVRTTQGEKTLAFTSLTLRLGTLLSFKRDYSAAEPLLAQAFAGAEAMGIADVQAGFAMSYGICLSEMGKHEEAIPILTRAHVALSKLPNPDPAGVQKLAAAMALSHGALGHDAEAESWRATTRPAAAQPATRPGDSSFQH